MKTPMFSVVVPLFNKESSIKRCIDSVLEQSYDNLELLVINDGSTDKSCKVLSEIVDTRLKVINKPNGGVSSARNTGIQHAKGKYIAFVDADDNYEPNFLEEIFNLIRHYPDADAYTTGYYKNKSGKQIKSYVPSGHRGVDFVVNDFFSLWANGSFFCASSVVVKSEYFLNHQKYFPVGESMGEDQDMWFHIAEHGKIAYTSKFMSNYNIESLNSLSYSSKITEELPFASRLRESLNSSNKSVRKGKMKFLEKYDLERSINNSISSNKREGLRLLARYALSLRFLDIKFLAILVLIFPSSLLVALRKFKRNIKK